MAEHEIGFASEMKVLPQPRRQGDVHDLAISARRLVPLQATLLHSARWGSKWVMLCFSTLGDPGTLGAPLNAHLAHRAAKAP
jgi:hypothetical protein